MEWVDASERLPEKGGRYLVKNKCTCRAHNCLAWNYPYPCGGINIAYYVYKGLWQFATDIPIEKDMQVSHWMELPEKPKEDKQKRYGEGKMPC